MEYDMPNIVDGATCLLSSITCQYLAKNTISIYSEDLTKNVTYRGAEVMGYG